MLMQESQVGRKGGEELVCSIMNTLQCGQKIVLQASNPVDHLSFEIT